MKTYYEVSVNSDQQDGRGSQIPMATFVHKKDAEKLLTNKSDMLGIEYRPVTVFESYDEYFDLVKENIRYKAMMKLTDEEKEILGLV